jgi:hypothetical protein
MFLQVACAPSSMLRSKKNAALRWDPDSGALAPTSASPVTTIVTRTSGPSNSNEQRLYERIPSTQAPGCAAIPAATSTPREPSLHSGDQLLVPVHRRTSSSPPPAAINGTLNAKTVLGLKSLTSQIKQNRTAVGTVGKRPLKTLASFLGGFLETARIATRMEVSDSTKPKRFKLNQRRGPRDCTDKPAARIRADTVHDSFTPYSIVGLASGVPGHSGGNSSFLTCSMTAGNSLCAFWRFSGLTQSFRTAIRPACTCERQTHCVSDHTVLPTQLIFGWATCEISCRTFIAKALAWILKIRCCLFQPQYHSCAYANELTGRPLVKPTWLASELSHLLYCLWTLHNEICIPFSSVGHPRSMISSRYLNG